MTSLKAENRALATIKTQAEAQRKEYLRLVAENDELHKRAAAAEGDKKKDK